MAQSNVKHQVELNEEQRVQLEKIVRSGTVSARRVRQARVLLLADQDRREGRQPDWYIAEVVGISARQVSRIRQQFGREGLDSTLSRKQRSDAGTPKTMDGRVEAQLVALCCSTPPEGQQRWTLQLLVDELCRLQVVATVSRETVRQTLKKIASSRGKRRGSAFRKPTEPASSPTWNEFSTSTKRNLTKRTR